MNDLPSDSILGRFDVHSHLLPAIDDGCETLAHSLECATRMVQAGYTHSFCTPHYWPNLDNHPDKTKRAVATLQDELTRAQIPLEIFPGGEIGLRESLRDEPLEMLPTFGMNRRFALCDLWTDRLPGWFEPTIRWMQQCGLTVILAHPERMRAVQDDPSLADYFQSLGMYLQGNLQCFSDRPHAATRQVAERYLMEGRYWLLGSDLHNPQSLQARLDGLAMAIELAGEEAIDRLTRHNPRVLMDSQGTI